MTTTIGEDLDRTTSGRFVRNLALSLSGGAVLTLLGASAAHADDLSDAGTESAGTGAAHSGDATAVGNQSGTNNTQTVTVSGNLGTIQIINQQANVSNVGVGVANTGGNIAIGNSSTNGATGTQTGTSALGPATNSGEASNGSNGSAAISTGNASSIGNQSNTTINQTANGSAHGLLGGILVINQDATVTNSGVALANTGGNRARGNDSENDAGLIQDSNNATGIAANSGKATNGSDGKATINTGNASATGNKSDTQITQSATGSAGGALGGLVIIDQHAFVSNTGVALANSGGNRATGNSSDNDANVDQGIGDSPVDADAIGVASNNGEASNWSGGTAGVTTGDASAIGNDSHTKVTQNAKSDIDGIGGGSIITQGSNVLNLGLGVANSGGNRARGNDSDNDATTTQDAPSTGGNVVGVIGNFGMASNTSDGTGTVSTGKASGVGNQSTTDVSQSAEAKGGAFNLFPQVNAVQNIGAGISNSGDNRARGNDSDNEATTTQDAVMDIDGVGIGVVGQFGLSDNTSGGTASITTGDASATGNKSSTTIGQSIDPTGLIIPIQVANVTNLGVAVANSGGNRAWGNESDNDASIDDQSADIGEGAGPGDFIVAGTMVASNNGEASNTSDGAASIRTGNASASGNDSATEIQQVSNGNIDGLGLIVNTQVAGVANVGLGVANSGLNRAHGNESDNTATIDDQTAEVGSDNAGDTTILAGVLTASNSGTASNTSDGSATIATGDAHATGNRSITKIGQEEGGDVSGIGGIINTQAAVVLNAGVGVANSGLNSAVGNESLNDSELDQKARIGSDNGGDTTVLAGIITAANNGTASNTSDGTANVSTGKAEATGNTSATDIDQEAGGDVSGLGLVLNTQVAGVANVGLGVANSGLNRAVGNASLNADPGDGVDPGANLEQDALIGSRNGVQGTDTDIAALSATASNSGEASNTSDGTGTVNTGGAQAQGNVSGTNITQDPGSSVSGLGLVIGTQVAGVANVGVGIANSGLNLAVGNASGQFDLFDNGDGNSANTTQDAEIGSNDGADVGVTVFGPAAATNSGTASNTSDGTAKVGTGGALATGNASATNIQQTQSGNVSEMGVVIGTQIGGVANVGVGVANSGLNAAFGNVSDNDTDLEQNALLASQEAAPASPLLIIGPAIASNSGEASNSSDGEACVCTGNAVASGNVSSTTLIQDLDLSTGSGLVVITEAGGVLNAGLGIANSGLNLAVGNASRNDAETTQDSTINDALIGLPIVGPQIASNGGTATNASDGAGRVGSGNASGTGNQSTTNFAQAAKVDSPLAINTLSGGTTNAGLGLANSGLNLGVGNASTNTAVLHQTADGAGLVSNQGDAKNESDGDATIGDPNCDVPGTPGTTTTPGTTGLPRTGGPIEAEAAIALMLLLMGFGLRRKGQSLA